MRRPTFCPSLPLAALLVLSALLAGSMPAHAQGVEITPFGGYRFGGDFFELATGQPVDLDGAPVLGVAVNIPLPRTRGSQIEALFSHEQADLTLRAQPYAPMTLARVTVDHWLGGGLQEFDVGHRGMRPFLTGMLGLTRYAGPADDEIRFTVSAGGGVKLFPTRHVGVRLDGRVYTTFVDADLGFALCGAPAGGCFLAFDTDVVWQAEFSAGVVVEFH